VGVDYWGYDLNYTVGVPSVQACQVLCQQNDQCLFFTYIPSISDCLLKTSNQNPTPNSDRVSGAKFCNSAVPAGTHAG
jgi:hypothetical protein